ARPGMARVRVAVEELDGAFRRRRHDRVVDTFGNRDRPHRLRAVGEALRHRHQIRRDAEALRGKGLAAAAEAADPFVEPEQDSGGVADFAQALQIALRRNEAAARTGDRLDETGGDVLGAVEGPEADEVLRELDAVRAFAAGEIVLLDVRVTHVRDAWHSATELATVVDETRQRDAAEVDPVVGALARDESRAAALAARLVGGERHLHRGVARL